MRGCARATRCSQITLGSTCHYYFTGSQRDHLDDCASDELSMGLRRKRLCTKCHIVPDLHGILADLFVGAITLAWQKKRSHYSLAICRPSGCTAASCVVVVVVGVCNRSQTRTSKCTCLIFGVSLYLWKSTSTAMGNDKTRGNCKISFQMQHTVVKALTTNSKHDQKRREHQLLSFIA